MLFYLYKNIIYYLHNKYPLIDDPDNCQSVMYSLINIYNDENTNNRTFLHFDNENDIFTNNLICYISGIRDSVNIESIMSFIYKELNYINKNKNEIKY